MQWGKIYIFTERNEYADTLRTHFVKQKLEGGIINMEHLSKNESSTNMFAKKLPKEENKICFKEYNILHHAVERSSTIEQEPGFLA